MTERHPHFLACAAIAALFSAVPVFAITVYAPKAPPTIPLLKAAASPSGTNISVILYDDVQSQVLPRILKKENALFIIPSNLAVKLWTKDAQFRLIGITSMGLLSLVSADPSVTRFSDLSNRTVSVGDPGSSPDAVTRIIFAWAGIKPKIVYSSSPEITRQFLGGRIASAVLPEHAATLAVTARTNARRIAEFKTLWRERHPGSAGIPQTALTARSDFLKKNRRSVRDLARSYRDAVTWCRKFPAEAAKFGAGTLDLKIPPVILEKSIPHMNLVFLSGKETRRDLLIYFQDLSSLDKTLTGGRSPDDAFFAE